MSSITLSPQQKTELATVDPFVTSYGSNCEPLTPMEAKPFVVQFAYPEGSVVLDLMIQNNLTTKDFAKKSGINLRTVQRMIKTGKISPRNAGKIKSKFGVSIVGSLAASAPANEAQRKAYRLAKNYRAEGFVGLKVVTPPQESTTIGFVPPQFFVDDIPQEETTDGV